MTKRSQGFSAARWSDTFTFWSSSCQRVSTAVSVFPATMWPVRPGSRMYSPKRASSSPSSSGGCTNPGLLRPGASRPAMRNPFTLSAGYVMGTLMTPTLRPAALSRPHTVAPSRSPPLRKRTFCRSAAYS